MKKLFKAFLLFSFCLSIVSINLVNASASSVMTKNEIVNKVLMIEENHVKDFDTPATRYYKIDGRNIQVRSIGVRAFLCPHCDRGRISIYVRYITETNENGVILSKYKITHYKCLDNCGFHETKEEKIV